MFKLKLPLQLLLMSVLFSNLIYAKTVKIHTDTWPPYINEQNQQLGIAANVIKLIARNSDTQIEWQYTPYEFSYHLVEQKKTILAFPYFKTKQRADKVLFSSPIFSVTSYLYYNRQFLDQAQLDNLNITKAHIGKVAGYSYGSQLDKKVVNATSYNSERQALLALLNNEIDLLPMTEEVMNSILKQHFPERVQLIKPLKQHADKAPLYLIASDNEQGRRALEIFNHSLEELNEAGIKTINTQLSFIENPVDHSKLITAEGYPAIIGQSKNKQGVTQYFALPNGTKAIVIKWSDKIKSPSKTDRLYKTMMDLSEVVILSGPHAGQVMFVRNMHIELL